MRQFVLVLAWILFITGAFALILPEQARGLGASVLRILGAGPEPLRIAVGDGVGPSHTWAETLAAQLTASGQEVQLLDAPNPTEAGALLTVREADLAILPAGAVSQYDHIALAQFDRAYLHVVVPQELEVTRFADIVEHAVGVSGVYNHDEALLTQLYEALALGNRSFTTPPRSFRLSEMGAALRQGQIDVLVGIFPLMDPNISAVLQAGYYRLLPLPEARAFSRLIPGLERDILPDNLYGPGRSLPPEPLEAVAAPLFLLTQPGANYDRIAAVLQALDQPAWQMAHPETTLAATSENSALPRHPLVQNHAFRALESGAQPSIFWLVITTAALAALVWHYYQAYQMRQRRVLASQVRGIIESGNHNMGEEGPGILVEMARQMMDGQNRAMQHWLSGRYNTLQMQLLMALYLGRSQQLLARYSMMPKNIEGAVHPQRRPWQAPQKTAIEGAVAPEEAGYRGQSQEAPFAPPPQEGARQVPPSAHSTGRSQRSTQRQAETADFQMAPAQEPPKTPPTEPIGEDITHEVLPEGYDGDIIAVRKRPRSQAADPEPQTTASTQTTPRPRSAPEKQSGKLQPKATPPAPKPRAKATANDVPPAEQAPHEQSGSSAAPGMPENTPASDAPPPDEAPAETVKEAPDAYASSDTAPDSDSDSPPTSKATESTPPAPKGNRKKRRKRRLSKADKENKADKARDPSQKSANTPKPKKAPTRSNRKKLEKGIDDNQMELF